MLPREYQVKEIENLFSDVLHDPFVLYVVSSDFVNDFS